MTHSSNVGLTCLLNGGENPKAECCSLNVVLVHGFGGHPKSTWSKSTLSTKQDGQRVPDETQTRGRRRYRFHDAERLKNKQANAQGTAIVPIGNASAEGSQLNLAGSASSDTSSKVFWPHDLLGLDFPSVRVMAYGYQPDQEESLQANLLSLSNHLLSTLESERRGVAGRPIVFIAHSLGGILVKKALDLSRLSTASIRNVTKGVIFFGTPHCKPHGKSWGELLKRIPGEFVATNTTLFTTLDSQLNEEELEAIRDVFEKMLSRPSNKKLFVVTFTGAVVGGPAGSTSCPVIPVESARINSSWAKTRTLEGTHETMCEFSSPSDPNYQLLKVELLLALQIIDDGKRKKEKQKLERKDRRDMQKQFLVQGEWFPKLLACPYWERKDEPNPPQTEGTCEWFLDHALYKYWRNSYTANILCVSADPGYGKSVLARHVAENVLPSNKSRLTCYFFFNNDYSDQKSVTGALLCILHQVFKDFPADFCPKALQTIIKNYEKTLELFHNFWDILLSVAERRKIKEVLCILDALDESSEPGRGQFIKALGKLHSQSRIKAVRLKFLVTSRPYLDTSSLGHQRVNLHLSGESDRGVGRISEVKFAIQQKAGTLIQKHRLGPEDGDFLIAELCRNPYPTYLWVYLVVEEADNILLNKENIQLKIQKLPQTVEEAYKNILAKVGDAESTRRVLHIILAAQRPLTLKEMSFALAIGPGHKPPGDNKLVPEAKVCNDIQDLCGAFVRIVNSKIYLVHQTAREFLVSSHEPVQPLDTNDDISPTSSSQWKSTFKPQESHQILAEICLERIALSDCRLDQHQDNMETSDDDVKGYPLMSYASQHWAEHFRKGDGMHKASIIKTAMDCFIARPLASQAWFGIHQTAGNFYVGPDKPTALALAAYFGLGVVVERLPKDALDTVNERSSGLTPLQWAVRGGHRGVVQQLIAAGADVDLRAEDGRAALHFAAERNDRVLMQQLVAAGANTNTHDMLKRTALHLAAGKGHPDMVQQLLAAGAAANIQDIHGKTALLSAMDSGNSVVVQRLVAGGSDISIQDTMGQTALQRAAKRGHIDIVQLLMGAGADIRVRDKEGQTALHHAASQGREAVVRQLIAAGSDIRTGDRRDRTPLELAARKRSGEVVQLLVGAGAEINHQDRDGNTALIWVAREVDNDIMQQLIGAGADMGLRDRCGRTAFLWAASLGHLATVQQLLAAGADASVRDQGGRTALDLAVANSRVGVEQFLKSMD